MNRLFNKQRLTNIGRKKAVVPILSAVSIFLFLLYFYRWRELLAAEFVLFLVFVPILSIAAIAYGLGAISEVGMERAFVKVRANAHQRAARRDRF